MPPLCKGRWRGVSRDERVVRVCYRQAQQPSRLASSAPSLTQGGRERGHMLGVVLQGDSYAPLRSAQNDAFPKNFRSRHSERYCCKSAAFAKKICLQSSFAKRSGRRFRQGVWRSQIPAKGALPRRVLGARKRRSLPPQGG